MLRRQVEGDERLGIVGKADALRLGYDAGREPDLPFDSTTCLSKTLRRLLLTKPIHIDTLLADTCSQVRKIAVVRHQAKPIKPAAVEEIHRVDNEGDVGRVLAAAVGELLLRDDRMPGENIGPGF